eukprot:Selendium_serpulae@DN1997_c0_g1_i2.p1
MANYPNSFPTAAPLANRDSSFHQNEDHCLEPPSVARDPAPMALESAHLDASDNLIFDNSATGMRRSFEIGAFYLRIPPTCDVADGDLFANHFFEDVKDEHLDATHNPNEMNSVQLNKYRGFKQVKRSTKYFGYSDYEDQQWEQFSLEQSEWEDMYPKSICELGFAMRDAGVAVLRNVLAFLSVPPTDWARATGGLTEKRGNHMLSFNHYRSEKNCRGLSFHRDSTWVTLLRATSPGLLGVFGEAPQCEEVRAIPVLANHLVVNFGSTIQLFTKLMTTPVRAFRHGVTRSLKCPCGEAESSRTAVVVPVSPDGNESREAKVDNTKGVSRQERDRTSFVCFLDSNFESLVYESVDGVLNPIKPAKEFVLDRESVFTQDLEKFNSHLD